MQAQVRKVFRSFVCVGLLSLVTVVVGIVCGLTWARWWPASVRSCGQWVQLGAGLLFLWATLSVLDWEIRTWGGTSPAERLNTLIFRVLNCTGMFILSASSIALMRIT